MDYILVFLIHNSSCFFIIDYLNTFDCLGIDLINIIYLINKNQYETKLILLVVIN